MLLASIAMHACHHASLFHASLSTACHLIKQHQKLPNPAAGGLTFAYRKIAADPAAATPGKLPVLCLHGLGSSSYTYRATGSLLAQAGHDVIAVDWPGHGGSSKVRRMAASQPGLCHFLAWRGSFQALPVQPA